MTETATAATYSTIEEHKFGTVGRPFPGCEIRIADDGEILVKGAEHLRRLLQDGRRLVRREGPRGLDAHRRPRARIDEDGYLSITGRKKDIIITAGGKNLTPANIENDMKQSRWVSQAVMHGDRRPFPVMLVTLDEEEIVPWAQQADGHRGHLDRGARAEPEGHRADPGRARPGQRPLRAGRAGQEVLHPRPRPLAGDRRADADPEGQAQHRQRQVRGPLRGALRRFGRVAPRRENRPHRQRRPLHRAPPGHAPVKYRALPAARHAARARCSTAGSRPRSSWRWCSSACCSSGRSRSRGCGSRRACSTGSTPSRVAIFAGFLGMLLTLLLGLRVLRRLDLTWILVRRAAGIDQREGVMSRVFAYSAAHRGDPVLRLADPHRRARLEPRPGSVGRWASSTTTSSSKGCPRRRSTRGCASRRPSASARRWRSSTRSTSA